MDQGLKERLVGAAVLVAIAVWLIPWVLDGPESGVETPASSLALPAAEEPMPMRTQTLRLGEDAATAAAPPAVTPPAAASATAARAESAQAARAETEAREEPKPEPGAAVAEAREEPQSPAAETAAPSARPESERTAATAQTAQPKAAAVPAGDWTVQLGSFGEEANARRMAQRAGTFGYKAEVSSYSSGGRTLYRVRVGPQRTRAEADAAASALRAHGIKEASVVAAR